MNDLMTEKERATALKRKQVAVALSQGWTYERIQAEFGVSSSTIALVKRLMKEQEQRWER